jgi:hypothetical protein
MLKFVLKVGLALLLLLATDAYAQLDSLALVPHVDKRVELMSIVFRLAGKPEYSISDLRTYSSDIDSFFAAFKNHPAIEFTKEIAAKNYVGYDAVMSMAVYLSQPPELKPLVEFTDSIPDYRWTKDGAERFVGLLRQFCAESNFEKFYADHEALYTTTAQRFQKVTRNVDLGWYKQFYGLAPQANYNILIGMSLGGGNYGPRVLIPGVKPELFSIICAARPDSSGIPTFGDYAISVIIHEFNHSFVNPTVDRNFEDFLPEADIVFQFVKEPMKRMAYGVARTMVAESLVRAAVISYFQSHGEDSTAIAVRIRREQANGFVWMDELYTAFMEYERNRTQYPTFESFIPVIEKFYSDLVQRVPMKIRAFDSTCVHVTSLEPFENKSESVDPLVTSITVHFEKALNPNRGFSIGYGADGKEGYPIVGDPAFDSTNTSLKLNVKLVPGHKYSFVLTPATFESFDGYPLRRYTVLFKTRQ